MKNPLRSEAEAFQFLVGAVVYFGLIAIAGVINAWAGLAVFIVLSVIVVQWWLRARRNEVAPKEAPRSRSQSAPPSLLKRGDERTARCLSEMRVL